MTLGRFLLAGAALLCACGRSETPPPDTIASGQTVVATAGTTAGTTAVETAGKTAVETAAKTAASPSRAGFPLIGVAVRDPARRWCVALPPDSVALRAGERVALVFATQETSATWHARLGAARTAQCHSAFPQPRWDGYRFHDLALTDTSAGAGDASGIALAVLSAAEWNQLGDRRLVADLDGDGSQEEARRCAADEGEHFTIWSFAPDGTPRRRAHEYYDWGALVERTCKPGEDGTG